MWLKFVPASIIAIVRIVCPRRIRKKPRRRIGRWVPGGRRERLGKKRFVRRHSRIAVLCAMLYAEPFPLKRKEEICAAGVLYAAVTQNSRKWKMASEEMKKGMRHNGLGARNRRWIVDCTETVRTTPTRRERMAMPERDLG
jgi:hypothetical protein